MKVPIFILLLLAGCTTAPTPLPVIPTKERVILDSELRTPVNMPPTVKANSLSREEVLKLLMSQLELLSISISKHKRLIDVTCKAFNCETETNVVNKE